MPGILGEWNSVWFEEREMWMMAGESAVRKALRRMFPMTHACSQVKWEKVKERSSRARSSRERVGDGSDSSIAVGEETPETSQESIHRERTVNIIQE